MKRKPFGRLGRIEKLENRRLMAVDVLSALPDLAVAPGAAPAVISLAGRYDDADVTGTIVRFDVNSPAPLGSKREKASSSIPPAASSVAIARSWAPPAWSTNCSPAARR